MVEHIVARATSAANNVTVPMSTTLDNTVSGAGNTVCCGHKQVTQMSCSHTKEIDPALLVERKVHVSHPEMDVGSVVQPASAVRNVGNTAACHVRSTSCLIPYVALCRDIGSAIVVTNSSPPAAK